jgi:hypothetical protein
MISLIPQTVRRYKNSFKVLFCFKLACIKNTRGVYCDNSADVCSKKVIFKQIHHLTYISLPFSPPFFKQCLVDFIVYIRICIYIMLIYVHTNTYNLLWFSLPLNIISSSRPTLLITLQHFLFYIIAPISLLLSSPF